MGGQEQGGGLELATKLQGGGFQLRRDRLIGPFGPSPPPPQGS